MKGQECEESMQGTSAVNASTSRREQQQLKTPQPQHPSTNTVSILGSRVIATKLFGCGEPLLSNGHVLNRLSLEHDRVGISLRYENIVLDAGICCCSWDTWTGH